MARWLEKRKRGGLTMNLCPPRIRRRLSFGECFLVSASFSPQVRTERPRVRFANPLGALILIAKRQAHWPPSGPPNG